MLYIIIFLLSLAFSLVFTPIVRKIMIKLGILDMPNLSRWHKEPIALMGGIAIFLSFMLSVFLRITFNREIIVVLTGGGVIFFVGLFDDLRGMPAKIKFLMEVVIAVTVTYFGIVCKIFPYKWLNIFINIFWIVGLTNALNMLDNIDGLSGGITFISVTGISLLAIQNGKVNEALLCIALAGSSLGFLRYNFKPAKIFMGDCGSLFLGYMLSTLAIIGLWQSETQIIKTFTSPILLMSVVIFDTTLVTILRLKHGKMPWQGGKDHSSHRLVYILKDNERAAVLILYGVGLVGFLLGLITQKTNILTSLIVAVIWCVVMILFGIRLSKIKCYHKN